MSAPSADAASSLLRTVGARPSGAPMRELTGGRWSVPALTLMGSQVCAPSDAPAHQLADVVLVVTARGWAVEKRAAKHQDAGGEIDPVATGAREGLR